MRLFPLLAALAAALASGRAFAQAAPPDASSSLEINEDGSPAPAPAPSISAVTMEFLRSIEARHGGAKSVQGSFDQVKTSEVFLEETKSKGNFAYLKPDLFRCDYAPPDELTNLIVRDAIHVHVPSLKQVERYRFRTPEERDQQLHIMVLGFGFKAETIAREYSVRSSVDDEALREDLKAEKFDPANTVLIEAVPAEAHKETSPFARLRLWIGRAKLLPEKVWFEDYGGDKTALTNIQAKFDAPIPPDHFEPKWPKGTEIIDKSEE